MEVCGRWHRLRDIWLLDVRTGWDPKSVRDHRTDTLWPLLRLVEHSSVSRLFLLCAVELISCISDLTPRDLKIDVLAFCTRPFNETARCLGLGEVRVSIHTGITKVGILDVRPLFGEQILDVCACGP